MAALIAPIWWLTYAILNNLSDQLALDNLFISICLLNLLGNPFEKNIYQLCVKLTFIPSENSSGSERRKKLPNQLYKWIIKVVTWVWVLIMSCTTVAKEKCKRSTIHWRLVCKTQDAVVRLNPIIINSYVWLHFINYCTHLWTGSRGKCLQKLVSLGWMSLSSINSWYQGLPY